jgi:LmbE family N-acetylglucosaminyl deacetylase
MMGTPENELDGSFWTADVDEAAQALAEILRDEDADILTIYDSDGNYGHPDHIQVHRVGLRAAELAGTATVFEGTINRDHVKRAVQAALEAGAEMGEDTPNPDSFETFGRPEELITTTVDVRDYLEQKRASMAAHASQISETSFFLAMPPEQFEGAFGHEWFIRRGVSETHRDDDLFAGIE